jgi:cytochrome c553
MWKQKFILASLLLCLGQVVQGEGDPVAGKQKALLCTQCHGIDGHSADPKIPKLAGQLASYIVSETTKFQTGIRNDPMMSGMSNVVKNPQDLEDIAAYFAAQPVMTGRPVSSSLFSVGEELFTNARCNFCHGEGGKRFAPFIDPTVPIIGGQHKPYIIKALNDIKDNKRPGDVYDMMIKLLAPLTDKQIEALAEYLSCL